MNLETAITKNSMILPDSEKKGRAISPILILPHNYPHQSENDIYVCISNTFPTNVRVFSSQEFFYSTKTYADAFRTEKIQTSYKRFRIDFENCAAIQELLIILSDLADKNHAFVDFSQYLSQSALIMSRFSEMLQTGKGIHRTDFGLKYGEKKTIEIVQLDF